MPMHAIRHASALKGDAMSLWLSTHPVNLAQSLATGMRSMQSKAVSLTRPPSLRRARAQVVRLITVVAGH
jgi:hypothetical protein